LKVGDHIINYAEFRAAKNGYKELAIYWLQSHDDTATQGYKQKIFTLYNKLINYDQQNAFIRITIPYNQLNGYSEEKAECVRFMTEFYPAFLNFIKTEN
jgi:EpsI family protein